MNKLVRVAPIRLEAKTLGAFKTPGHRLVVTGSTHKYRARPLSSTLGYLSGRREANAIANVSAGPHCTRELTWPVSMTLLGVTCLEALCAARRAFVLPDRAELAVN